jgi:tetratricopeptide (TPR) repeat protein
LHNDDDLDALKCQGSLYLRRGDLDSAANSFERLKRCSNGDDNAGYRAEAHLGLASVCISRGVTEYQNAIQSLTTALRNYSNLPPHRQDVITGACIQQQFGNIYGNASFTDRDPEKALQYFRESQRLLSAIPKRRGLARQRYHEVTAEIIRLAPES